MPPFRLTVYVTGGEFIKYFGSQLAAEGYLIRKQVNRGNQFQGAKLYEWKEKHGREDFVVDYDNEANYKFSI